MKEFAAVKKLPDSHPLVSIVLPTFNCDRYLSISIESCLKQTYQNFELIVVDGGSTDNTLQIVKGVGDPRIRIYHQPANTGRLPGALNIGFSHAQGDFYTWAQGDDYYKTEAIEVMVSYLLRNPEVGLVYTGMWMIDGDGCVMSESKILSPDTLVSANPVQHCFLYRREVAERVGEYNVDFLMVEDVEYWMRIYKNFKVAVIKDRYYYHRFHSESLTIKNYGGHLAQRRLADASKFHFGTGWLQYRKRIAQVYIDEAFAAFENNDYKHVLACISKGTMHNPMWLGKRGVLSIGTQSLSNILRGA